MRTLDSDLLFPLLLGAVALSLFCVWLYALISALKNERLDSTMKLVWVLVIVFVTGLGAILYLLLAPGRPTRFEREMAQRRERDQRRSAPRGTLPQ